MASLGIVLRGRRRESCALAKIAGFRGPVREIACAGARSRVAGCDDGRRACRACGVCGAVPWGLLLGVSRGCWCAMGIAGGRSRGWRCAKRIAGGRVACVALCHGDCYWACRVGGAVPWGLLLGVSRGWRCAVGIAAGVGAAVCHGDCCWACRGCGGVHGGLVGVSRGWRRVLGIADQGVVWVAPCLRDC